MSEIKPDQFNWNNYRMPAEWEPHEATWLVWPTNDETWPGKTSVVQEIWTKMISALCPHERVYVLVNDCEASDQLSERLSGIQVGKENVKPVIIKNNDAWVRDSGPNFILSKDKSEPRIVANDFIFNSWGKKYGPWDDDDQIPVHAAHLLGVPYIRHDLVLEGGSIDVNGLGTLLTTTQCLLNQNRNPHLTQAQIEEKVRQFLGLTNVIWLEDGIEGDDTDGHVDDITRFVAPRKIVTVIEHNATDANFAPLKANVKKLEKSTDQDGKGIEIIELPMPRKFEGPFGRCPASYANFYIANNVVLVPTYSCDNDDVALEILSKAFPDRQIVGIECSPVVAGLGSIHCVTQQQPKVV